ncbi:hypothetical protein ABFY27_13370 [Akkermansia massiliensis]
MDILVSTLCDFAADYQGKLCIQGGFDSLVARQFPVVHPVCAVALRICLTPEDEGTHELGLSIVDADGTPLDKERMPIKINFPVPAFPEGASFFTRNLIMNFQGLRFEKPGNYSIDLTVDGELASRVPFRVVQVQEEAPRPKNNLLFHQTASRSPGRRFFVGVHGVPVCPKEGDENHRFHVPMKAGSLTKPPPGAEEAFRPSY